MRYESVIWDWNGTLLDDVSLAIGIVNEILQEHGVAELSLAHYRAIFDFPVQLYYERAGIDFASVTFESVSARYCEEFENRIRHAQLFDDVVPSLDAIQKLGVRQFLLSSTEHTALTRMVAAYDIQSRFHDIRGMPDGLAKGKKDMAHELVRANGIEPKRSIMIGDTQHDLQVADALGMSCVLVATGHHSAERLQSLGCPVLDSVREVPALLRDS